MRIWLKKCEEYFIRQISSKISENFEIKKKRLNLSGSEIFFLFDQILFDSQFKGW
jgi:hypothetical protein